PAGEIEPRPALEDDPRDEEDDRADEHARRRQADRPAEVADDVARQPSPEVRRERRGRHAGGGGAKADGGLGRHLERAEVEEGPDGEQTDAGGLPDRRPLGAAGEGEERDPGRNRGE